MKRSLTIAALLGLLSLGVFAAIALADTGAGPGDTSTGLTTGTDTNASDSTSSTGTTDGTTTGTNTTAPMKVWLCHRTHSKKHPYRLIHVSVHAEAAHLKHGDFVAAAGADCAAPSTSSSTSTETTATNTTHGHGAGKSGDSHGKGHH